MVRENCKSVKDILVTMNRRSYKQSLHTKEQLNYGNHYLKYGNHHLKYGNHYLKYGNHYLKRHQFHIEIFTDVLCDSIYMNAGNQFNIRNLYMYDKIYVIIP